MRPPVIATPACATVVAKPLPLEPRRSLHSGVRLPLGHRTSKRALVDVIQLIPTHATIRPWIDPVVDARGHDPRSAYVERFWLERHRPDRDVDHASIRRRVRSRTGRLHTRSASCRHVDGSLVHQGPQLAVRQGASPMRDVRAGATPERRLRRSPPVPDRRAQRHLRRLPDDLQATHDEWARRMVRPDRHDIERRLTEAGVPAGAIARAYEAVAMAS